jgi:hypothetical protein
MKRFILFHGKRHPHEIGVQEVPQCLSPLVVVGCAPPPPRAGRQGQEATLVDFYKQQLRAHHHRLPVTESSAESQIGKHVAPDILVWAIGALAEDFLPFVNSNLPHFLPHLHYRLTTHPACILARTTTQHGHQDTP